LNALLGLRPVKFIEVSPCLCFGDVTVEGFAEVVEAITFGLFVSKNPSRRYVSASSPKF